MIQELQLRILPEEAVNEQSLKQVVSQKIFRLCVY